MVVVAVTGLGCSPDPLAATLAAGDRIVDVPDSSARIVLSGDAYYRISFDSVSLGRRFRQKPIIQTSRGGFDPLVTHPMSLVPEGLREKLDPHDPAGQKAYIVQFVSQPIEAMQQSLRSLGVQLYAPLGGHALIVHMDDASAREVRALPFVRWAGDYLPAFKLEDAIIERAANLTAEVSRYSVLVMGDNERMQAEVAFHVEMLGGTVDLLTTSRRMEVSLDGYGLGELARMNEVLFVDRWGPPEPDMDIARETGGGNHLETVEGYTGQGVRAEVMDNGLRTTHQDFQANPVLIHNGNSTITGHGTSVFGIVFGSGASDATARGMIPDAEQPIFSSHSLLEDRRYHTSSLVNPNGSYRAVFQTNSWGSTQTMNYTTVSAEMDEILFDLDFVILQSQSNACSQQSRAQAWAKNIISVGGVFHYNTLDKSDDMWSGGGTCASIGPAEDGRIKPDLWHFYDDTWTTNDDSDTDHRNFGGTSGATPITAGHAGLVFQMWADGVFDGGPGKNRDVFAFRPHMTTIKALLVNSAHQYSFSGTSHDKTRVHQGWGMADVKNLYETAKARGWSLPILIDESSIIAPGGTDTYTLSVTAGSTLKATMVYADPAGTPGTLPHRVNDLTLKVTGPASTVYWGNNGLLASMWSASGGSPNDLDTVENVFIQSAAAGTWTIEVLADEIVQDGHVETATMDADYALVVTAKVAGPKPPDVTIDAPADGSSFPPDTSVTFEGTAVDPEDGDISGGISWSSDLDGNLGTGTTLSATLSMGTHTITAAATDSDGMTGSESITVSINPPVSYATLPYSTGFESGALDEYWAVYRSTGVGRIQVTGNHGPQTGAFHLTMDVDTDGNVNTNEAWLRLDLSDETEVALGFSWKEFGDEDNDEDGVFFSDDGGATFAKVQSLTGGSTTYQAFVLDLDSLAAAHGLSLTSVFVVKLQQHDNYRITSDGFAFDDISVTAGTSQPYAIPPYHTGFEGGTLDQYWTAQSSAPVGRIQVTGANGPHGGSSHLTMDVSTSGTYNTNEARLHLDLSAATAVELSFWWKEFSDETHSHDGVFFSDNGGASFVKVYDLSGGTSTYQEIILGVDELAAANGLSLTSNFVVKLQQYDNYVITTDGFAFDDLSVATGG